MKNMLITFVLIIPLIITNCKKEPSKSVVVTMHVDIAYQNKSGNDLLDSTIQNAFLTKNIHVYNVTKGIKKEVYYPTADYPHNFEIYKQDNLTPFYLRLFLETDTTLLELNQSITDTITCISERSNGNFLLKKLWYNGVMKWGNDPVPQEFTIIK